MKRNPPAACASATSSWLRPPVAVQSMCATKTQDVDATVEQAEAHPEGGRLPRPDRRGQPKDVEALADVRRQTRANLVVDLQESYRLAETVAPHVDKIRYNPGHLWHHERAKPVREKVAYLVDVARANDLAVRIGVNCGSVDPEVKARHPEDDVQAMVASALEHCRYMDDLGFDRYVVSLKDSHPRKVIEANRRFAEARPDVPLHLGVTEAGIPPEGVVKTRWRSSSSSPGNRRHPAVSLTLPTQEARGGRGRPPDPGRRRGRTLPVRAGVRRRQAQHHLLPSCSRVENERSWSSRRR